VGRPQWGAVYPGNEKAQVGSGVGSKVDAIKKVYGQMEKWVLKVNGSGSTEWTTSTRFVSNTLNRTKKVKKRTT